MSAITSIFVNLERLTRANEGEQDNFIASALKVKDDGKNSDIAMINDSFLNQKQFVCRIIKEIDQLTYLLSEDEQILISVKQQKTLQSCFQFVTSLGILPCLLPGLGINISKRSPSASRVPSVKWSHEQKYELLVTCTDFFTRCYNIVTFKKIILIFHLPDYLASLIQLAFAPLRKPGVYHNFTMTQEMFTKFNEERLKYVKIFDKLMKNSFQPMIIKELLVLQGMKEPPPPLFVKKIITKELDSRLLAPDGLLSLIRCFVETHSIDTGTDWKKVDVISKIVSANHGSMSCSDYLKNICSQLCHIFDTKDKNIIIIATSCIIQLNQQYPESEYVKSLVREILQSFNYEYLLSKCDLPETIVVTPQEIEHNLNILHLCVTHMTVDFPVHLLLPNLYLLFYIGMKCTKSKEIINKTNEILDKTFNYLNKKDISSLLKSVIFGTNCVRSNNKFLVLEENESGIFIKYCTSAPERSKNDAVSYFMKIFNLSSSTTFVCNVFDECLQSLVELNNQRREKLEREVLLSSDDDITLLDDVDEQYLTVLQLLSELVSSKKVIIALNTEPTIFVNFIKHFVLKSEKNEECLTIALVLLNTIITNTNNDKLIQESCSDLIPVLKEIATTGDGYNSLLCKEALSFIANGNKKKAETELEKALHDTFDDMLPIRVHGIIRIIKLIESKDPQTISKKHYIFCLFQENLKNTDSYMYLSVINGIAALGTYFPEEVLETLCKEFLQVSLEHNDLDDDDYDDTKISEMRMKIGDVIVKITKALGEMAIVHKTLLLNTMLCGCREDDPLIKASALSNLAEIVRVLNYKIGTIIYEVLLCVGNIIDSDKVVECRRAAVMVISSLLKGLGKETLMQLKENLLPMYRTLKNIYRDNNEDSVVRLHAQIALEELNSIVSEFLFPKLDMEKEIFVVNKPDDFFK